MRISYDPEVDALFLQLRDCAPGSVESRELGTGVVGDFGPDGNLSGIEILDASRVLGSNKERVVVELSPSLTLRP